MSVSGLHKAHDELLWYKKEKRSSADWLPMARDNVNPKCCKHYNTVGPCDRYAIINRYFITSESCLQKLSCSLQHQIVSRHENMKKLWVSFSNMICFPSWLNVKNIKHVNQKREGKKQFVFNLRDISHQISEARLYKVVTCLKVWRSKLKHLFTFTFDTIMS